MASVRKRKWTHKGEEKEAWIVNYVDDLGKRKQKTFDKKKEADRFRTTVESELINGMHVSEERKVKVDFAVEAYLKDCERRYKIGDSMSHYTLVNYRFCARSIVGRFGKMVLADLSRNDVQAWVNDLSEKYKRKTVARLHLIMGQMLKHARRMGWIRRHILLDDPIRMPSIADERITTPNRQQIVALIRHAIDLSNERTRPRLKLTRAAMIVLGILCGLRRGEMAGLTWENIDFERSIIKVRNSYCRYDGMKAPKTAAGVRNIPMSSITREILLKLRSYWLLRQHLYNGRGSGANAASLNTLLNNRVKQGAWLSGAEKLEGQVLKIVRNNDDASNLTSEWGYGRPMCLNQMTGQHWYFIMEGAGLLVGGKPPFTLHALRHAAASLLIENGLPAMNLKEVMGHAKVATTYNVYGHLFPDDERTGNAISAISAALTATTERHTPVSI